MDFLLSRAKCMLDHICRFGWALLTAFFCGQELRRPEKRDGSVGLVPLSVWSGFMHWMDGGYDALMRYRSFCQDEEMHDDGNRG